MGTIAAFSHPPPISAFNYPLSAALNSVSDMAILFPKLFGSLKSAMFRKQNMHWPQEC